MCGIAGYVGKGSRARLDKMLDAIKSRGPDDRGAWVDGEIGLGNNRLSIIDLSKNGHQPLFNEDNSICIVYNGEVYNFQTLRKKLEGKHKFKSHTDTEVILHAYEEWGIDCLKRLNGMFAFVIYDRKKNLLFGARDRLGEKPLKYYWDGKLFAFASEVKGLFPMLPQKPEVDPQAIDNFLTLQYVPAPRTGLKNISKLPPASYFVFHKGKLKIARYWEIDFSNKLKLEEVEWEDLLFEKIKESVKTRMISDVPIGAFLSGGVDSSSVVALMASFSKRKVKTFNIGFDDSEFDETTYAKQVSDLYKTEHYSLEINAKMMQNLLINSCNFYDEPLADNSFIPTLLLSEMASKKAKVVLSGDGGDENFAGYDRYNIVQFSEVYTKVPRLVRRILCLYPNQMTASLWRSKFLERASIYTKTFELPFYRRYLYYNSFFTNDKKEKLYSKNFRKRIRGNDTFNIFREQYNSGFSNLDNALNFDITSYLPEDLLYKTDIASMAFSLEVRAPLLNHEIIELTAQIPANLKIKLLEKKYIFKKLLAKSGILPENIIYREKRGFIAPIGKWLRGNLKNFLLDQINSRKVKQADIFESRNLERYLADYFLKKHNESNNVFALLSLSSWLNKYF